MTPQEFRDAYLEAQDALGNRLQNLEGFACELTQLTKLLRADYERLNGVVEQFVDVQTAEDSSASGSSD